MFVIGNQLNIVIPENCLDVYGQTNDAWHKPTSQIIISFSIPNQQPPEWKIYV